MYGGMKRIKEINYIFVLNFCGITKNSIIHVCVVSDTSKSAAALNLFITGVLILCTLKHCV